METQWQIMCSGTLKAQAEIEELQANSISVLMHFPLYVNCITTCW